MKKILVPVDFSEHTANICHFALEIAKKTGAEIRLFHAYFDYAILTGGSFPYPLEGTEFFSQDTLFQIRESALAEMLELESRLKKQLTDEKIENVWIVHTLTGGIPEEEIMNIAETYNPDLIVIGTRGKGQKDMLTGRITSRVVMNATCRVLTVPYGAEYKGINRILYATDFNDENVRDIQRLIDLVNDYNPVIHCVHVNLEKDSGADMEKMEQLRNHFSDPGLSEKLLFTIIEEEDFLQAIDNYVSAHQIDMIAIIRHRKGFIRRLFSKDRTRELLFHSHLPLYIFPGAES